MSDSLAEVAEVCVKEVETHSEEGTLIMKIDFQMSHRLKEGTSDKFWGSQGTGFETPCVNRGT